MSQGGPFFLANSGVLGKGKGFEKQGFAICKNCGRDLSEKLQQERASNSRRRGSRDKNQSGSRNITLNHNHPITGKQCSLFYEQIHLGHEFRSDLIKIQFTPASQQIYCTLTWKSSYRFFKKSCLQLLKLLKH
ncbi:MAG: hypothetical protein ACFCU5_03720 [Pleurocapsa sp.]